MDPTTVKVVATAYSMRWEARTILTVLFMIFLIPVLTVLLLTQVGLNIVSDILVSGNPQDAQVDIHDPKTGEVLYHITETVVWPTSGIITLEFGEASPYQLFHTGIDIANGEVGDPVGTFMSGKVIATDNLSWGFGRHVIIDHGYFVNSIYAHLDTISVKVGDEVTMGQVIGTRGNTGWSTGPHLHFQINVFKIPVNPRLFLTGNP